MKCQLFKLNGFNCRFEAKYPVKVTGENQDTGKTQTKEAIICGKHLARLKQEAEASGEFKVIENGES